LSLEGADLREAQAARAERVALGETRPTTPGGNQVPRTRELLETLGVNLSDLSPEQQAAYNAALADEQAQEERERQARQDRQSAAANQYLSELATALGLSAPEGETDPAKSLDPAVARYVRGVFMSDDGGPAVNLSFEAEGGTRTQPVQATAVDILKGFVGAFPKDPKGTVTLSQQARALPGDSGHPAEHKVEEAGAAPGDSGPKDSKSKADELAAMFSEQGFQGSDLFVATNNGGNS
jgi:hypothetical protein